MKATRTDERQSQPVGDRKISEFKPSSISTLLGKGALLPVAVPAEKDGVAMGNYKIPLDSLIGDNASVEPYDDTELKNRIEQEESARQVADDFEAQARSNSDAIIAQNLIKEITDRQSADADLQNQIDVLHGAILYLGFINYTTAQITANKGLLTSWCEAANRLPLKLGYLIVDSNANDWVWNGEEWVNIGYYDVAKATNTSLGVVQGNDVDLGVVVDANGKMSVKGLSVALNGKANAADLTSHISNKSNPHSVTYAQLPDKPTIPTVPSGIVSGYTKLLTDENRSAVGWKPIAYVSYAEITSTTYDMAFSLMWVPTISHTFGVYHRPIPKFVGFVFDVRIDGYLLQHDGRPTMTAIKDNVNSRWIIVVPAPGGYTVGSWLCNDPNNLVTPWAGAAIPDISGYTQSQYVSPFGGTPAQFVKGDGSLDSNEYAFKPSQSEILIGKENPGTNGRPLLVQWTPNVGGQRLTLRGYLYDIGEVIDVIVIPIDWPYNVARTQDLYFLDQKEPSKAGVQYNTVIFHGCNPILFKIVKESTGLKYVCNHPVDV